MLTGLKWSHQYYETKVRSKRDVDLGISITYRRARAVPELPRTASSR